ncbi:MAG: hypothetical protein HY942_03430 [Gammaproteobacteria bacterium]|nr:hypothetical protein [Gammaproteobacteria bacterium]
MMSARRNAIATGAGLAGLVASVVPALAELPYRYTLDPGIEAAADIDDALAGRRLPMVEAAAEPGARLRLPGLERTYFGLGDRYLFATDKFLFMHVATPETATARADNGLPDLVGGIGYGDGGHRFSIPIVHQTLLSEDRVRRLDAYGLEWRGRFGVGHELALSARHGEYGALDGGGRDSAGNVAQFAWSGAFAGSYRPRLVGSVFLGDETAKDKGPKWFGRKYYGLSVDGRFTPFEKHTPYASLYLQRSDYDAVETLTARREDYSRLAAGWNWQVRPNWGLRAEAYYVLNSSAQSAYDYERGQILFSTRFDFK